MIAICADITYLGMVCSTELHLFMHTVSVHGCSQKLCIDIVSHKQLIWHTSLLSILASVISPSSWSICGGCIQEACGACGRDEIVYRSFWLLVTFQQGSNGRGELSPVEPSRQCSLPVFKPWVNILVSMQALRIWRLEYMTPGCSVALTWAE